MRRLAILVTAAVAATAIAGILSTTGGAQQPGERTLRSSGGGHLQVRRQPAEGQEPSQPNIIDGRRVRLFTSPLRNEANKPIGTVHVFCAVTRGGNFSRASSQCNGTYALRDGTLAASAVLRGEEASIAVVGGTGAYEGARGSITDRDLPRDRTEDTIHLLP